MSALAPLTIDDTIHSHSLTFKWEITLPLKETKYICCYGLQTKKDHVSSRDVSTLNVLFFLGSQHNLHLSPLRWLLQIWTKRRHCIHFKLTENNWKLKSITALQIETIHSQCLYEGLWHGKESQAGSETQMCRLVTSWSRREKRPLNNNILIHAFRLRLLVEQLVKRGEKAGGGRRRSGF